MNPPVPGLRDHLATIDVADYNRLGIAAQFNCHPTVVSRIWRSTRADSLTAKRSAPAPKRAALAAFMATAESELLTFAEIADRIGCHKHTVSNLARRLNFVRGRGNGVRRGARIDPNLPIRLRVANAYLGRLVPPCQCVNHQAASGEHKSAPGRRIYKSPRFDHRRPSEL